MATYIYWNKTYIHTQKLDTSVNSGSIGKNQKQEMAQISFNM